MSTATLSVTLYINILKNLNKGMQGVVLIL